MQDVECKIIKICAQTAKGVYLQSYYTSDTLVRNPYLSSMRKIRCAAAIKQDHAQKSLAQAVMHKRVNAVK